MANVRRSLLAGRPVAVRRIPADGPPAAGARRRRFGPPRLTPVSVTVRTTITVTSGDQLQRVATAISVTSTADVTEHSATLTTAIKVTHKFTGTAGDLGTGRYRR